MFYSTGILLNQTETVINASIVYIFFLFKCHRKIIYKYNISSHLADENAQITNNHCEYNCEVLHIYLFSPNNSLSFRPVNFASYTATNIYA